MTRRSRSSFDLRDALVTAEALSPKPPSVEQPTSEYDGIPLVAFGQERPSQVPAPLMQPPRTVKRTLPDPPDVDSIASLVPKLGKLLDWLRKDSDTTRALVVDDEGLPLVGTAVGDLGETESLFAATGSVAAAMKKLALATPGTLSPDFEGHVGEGPVLQLIGFSASRRAFVVAVSRKEPFGAKDVDLIRQTFASALATSVIGGTSLAPAQSSGRPSAPPGNRGNNRDRGEQ
jgi:hypothetical protein